MRIQLKRVDGEWHFLVQKKVMTTLQSIGNFTPVVVALQYHRLQTQLPSKPTGFEQSSNFR